MSASDLSSQRGADHELRARSVNASQDEATKENVPLSHKSSTADAGTQKSTRQGAAGDRWNIAVLLLLYILQGLPMGLSAFVKMRLKAIFTGSFAEVGVFALATWPFSLKMFWAPIVDVCYIERFGRRKSWLVPSQLLIAGGLLYLSFSIEGLFAAGDYTTLTMCFFALYFLCATQDIAVDGWSITMLDPDNASYASTCNAAGQGIGFFLGMIGPTSVSVSLPSFFQLVAMLFLVTTLAIWALKREAPTPPDETIDGVLLAYRSMASVLRLPAVKILIGLLLTRSIAFVPMDEMILGRLQDAGLSTAWIAWLRSATTPLEFVIPWCLTAHPTWKRPLHIIHAFYLPRVLLGAMGTVLVFCVGNIGDPAPATTIMPVFVLTLLQGVCMEVMFGAHFGFFAVVSDPRIGGTYMTVLGALHNLGNSWAVFACLQSSDVLQSATGYDGFFLLSAACSAIGVIWFLVAGNLLKDLQARPPQDWKVLIS